MPYPFTVEHADTIIATRFRAEIKEPSGGTRLAGRAIRDHTYKLIGSIGLRYDTSENEYELGYSLGEAYHRRCIMTVALSKVLETMSGALITVTVAEDNIQSAGVLLKNLFVQVPDNSHYIQFPESKGGENRHFKYFRQL